MKTLVMFAIASAVILPGCRQPDSIPVEVVEDTGDELSSLVHVADPKSSRQLVKGFHNVEQNAWRWTMGEFAVLLRPPADAATRGAVLSLRFSIPEPVMNKVGETTLSATLAGVVLEPETYKQAGEYLYSREVPRDLLVGDSVLAEFSLSKFLAPGDADQRELGLVVSSIGLDLQ